MDQTVIEKEPQKRDVVEDIAVLLRGFFATPIISTLGRMNILDKMGAAQEFKAADYPEVKNPKILHDSFRYLLRIGLLEYAGNSGEVFKATPLGKEIFRRANSFYVPHSYFEYMCHYDELIKKEPGEVRCAVERLENVIGSGKTHLRYFPPVISYMKRKFDFDVLADIGCGDGQFLSTFIRNVPGKKVVGIDLSGLSTEETQKNIRRQFPSQEITVVTCDALDVERWSKELLEAAGGGRITFSMWFLLHEISRNKTQNLVDFFLKIHQIFPSSPIMVGEVVRQSDDIHVRQHHKSLMPEYLFFHEMSGQGILAWDEYRAVLDKIPYELVMERLFDEAEDSDGKSEPSTFVWGLTPR